ncbi:Mechanosensitive ion channel-domain-containing protein [Desarmillaria tabescens]|uniref:Mechanosensitive ion channel-domain-containing protein n=1 Tax=Armillaria tabescens TaxID=1929756 RepID=A0AA39NQN2_ARMTA|nr:Mechanosensitive ion channel-domain-containing protein [Desarmillaria tabescens]KAK0470035.1 Mechanosensitive ion channel-domain-containing protein [Desarmillaria tabescens]
MGRASPPPTFPVTRDYAPVATSSSPTNEHEKKPSTSTRASTDSDTTATHTSDEFNWSDNDSSGPKNGDGVKAKRGRLIYLAFIKLSRWVRVLIIGILGCAILITPLLVVQLRFKELTSSVRTQVHVWSLWLTVIWAAACVTYLVVDAIPRLIVGLIVVFGGQLERLKMQIELALAVQGWVKLTFDISWAWIALSVIRTVYKPAGNYWVIINRIMQALFAAGIIILAEKVFLQFVAINFHQKALADRLTENKLGLRALDRLSNAQPVFGIGNKRPKRRGHKSPGASMDLNSAAQHGRNQSQSQLGHGNEMDANKEKPATASRSAQRRRKRKNFMSGVIVDQVGGAIDQVGDAIGQVALKNSKFNREGDLGGLYSARKLARKLFRSLNDVDPDRDHLIVEDFYPYFRSTQEATTAFALFDKDGNGDISKREMREAVQRIYRERKSLIASLKDAGSAVAKLDAVLLCCSLVGIIFCCLLIFNKSNTLESLVPLATIILGFSFIFGNAAATLFNSLIFIFSTHVFDVGDLVMIDDQALMVREFGLFSTTFRRVDGQEIIAPNSLLSSAKLIHNLRRSSSMWETTNIQLAYNTPLPVIEEIRTCIKAFVTENNREWSGMDLNIDKMEYQNAIHLIVAMEHRPNWQDWGARWVRRTKFMRNLKTILEDLDVRWTMPVQPVLLPRDGQQHLHPLQHQSLYMASRETLGNAGSFRGSQHLSAPSPGFRGTNAEGGF